MLFNAQAYVGREPEDSEPLEGEVAVEAEHRLAPHEYEGRLLHSEDSVVHKAHGVPESAAEKVRHEDEHLRLACWQLLCVLLLLLIVSKEELDWCCIVGILPREDDFHTKLEQVLADLPAAVVGRVV